MKFGKVDNIKGLDLSLPNDHSTTIDKLKNNNATNFSINVGCAKWNRSDLKNFYPRGTKDELVYYSTQFNSIELNAFFYRIFPPEQVIKWKEKTTDNFKFCPKIPQVISQFKRLKNVQNELDEYLNSIYQFEEKLGMCFLQMHPNFSPKSFDTLESFINLWPKDVSLSVELRHPEWYSDQNNFDMLCQLLDSNGITHTITDTAGRRDLIHMRLTTAKCFVRYTGANDISDYRRLDDWVIRLKEWKENGIDEVNFFIHQNLEIESPLLTAYFNKKLNNIEGINLTIPRTLNNPSNPKLF